MEMTLRKLRRENRERMKKLPEKDRESLLAIREYFKEEKMGAVDGELLARDLIGMAEEAGLRGESFESAMGEDIKSWCESVKESCGSASSREKLLFAVQRICGGLSLYCIIFLGWGYEIKDNLPAIKIFAFSVYALALILGEYLGWGKLRNNFVFYTEKEKTQAEARIGFIQIAVIAAALVVGWAIPFIRNTVFRGTGISSLLWAAFLGLYLFSSLLIKCLTDSELERKLNL